VNPDEEEALRKVQALTEKADKVIDTMTTRLDNISAALQELIDYLNAHPEQARLIGSPQREP
jgi:hypothetical protein